MNIASKSSDLRNGARLFDGTMNRSAVFSDCGIYRYSLTRVWDESKPSACCIFLNPSVGDGAKDDPTIKRVIKWLHNIHDLGSFELVNLFALQSPTPRILKESGDPVGHQNDDVIRTAVANANLTIVGWGLGGHFQNRDQWVVDNLLAGASTFCFGFTKDGTPIHPSPRNTHLTGELFAFPRDE